MRTTKWLKIAPRPGRYARSAETVEQILEATLQVLMRDGHASLTFRSVSEECGLKVGHISYHFPTKEDLVRGLLDAVMEGYSDRAERLVYGISGGEKATLRAAIISILRDVQTFETTHLFPELWSMANHDPVVEARVQEFYTRARVRVEALIRSLNPALGARDAETLCLFFSSFAEGVTLFAGHGKPYADRMADFAAIAIHSFINLAETITAEQMHAIRAEWAAADGPASANPSASDIS